MNDELFHSHGRLWTMFRSHRGRPIHKWTQYFAAYERHFQRFVNTKPFMLEIGCGLGGSLEMWQTYFGDGCRIVGIDIRQECAEYAKPELGIEVRIGDQSDHRFLASLIEEFGTPNVVLDDGSHVMKHVNGTFDYLYEKTDPNGVYMVEDLHTAYWPRFGGGLRQSSSFIERSKGLLDEMHQRYTDGVISPTPFSKGTESIHVYDSLIAFERKSNQSRIALEIGGEANDVRETTSTILSLGRGASQVASQPQIAQPAPSISSAPVIASRPGASLHIHLAAMAPRFLDVRTYLPLREIDKTNDVSTSSSEKKIEFPRLSVEQPKIMILQRMAIKNAGEWAAAMNQLEKKGWIVVSEMDDHPDLLGRVHSKEVDASSWNAARFVHAVQTSTEALAGELRAHNPEVAVFRNAAFKPPVAKQQKTSPGLRVFYGALNREGYSAQVGASLAPFAAKHPDVEFVVVHDRAFFNALGPCNRLFHPTTSTYDSYIALMATCDICLMPLEGQFGELFKSDLKFVEASSVGLVSIASVPVYGATIRDGETGLIAEGLADWPRQLERLVLDPALCERVALAAQDYVRRERQFSHQVGKRMDWYRDLWVRRSKLSDGLQKRTATL